MAMLVRSVMSAFSFSTIDAIARGSQSLPWCAVLGFGFRVSGFGERVKGSGLRASGFEFRFSGFGFRVAEFGSRVQASQTVAGLRRGDVREEKVSLPTR